VGEAVQGPLFEGGVGVDAGGDGVFELDRPQPAFAIDAEVAEQLDVGGWPAEADAADPPPLTQHRGQARPR
jgi:hypothetical protein